MAEIIVLGGGPIPTHGEPNPRLVEVLEMYLERARAGEITGAVVSVRHSDETVSGSRTGLICYRMIGMCSQQLYELQHDVMTAEA